MEPYDDRLIDLGLVGGGADTVGCGDIGDGRCVCGTGGADAGDVGDGSCVDDDGCGAVGNGRCCVGGAGAGRLVDGVCLGTAAAAVSFILKLRLSVETLDVPLSYRGDACSNLVRAS